MNRLNYKKTFLLGFGFFAISVTWSVYNSFVPVLLNKFITSATIIGFIMTIDNYFGLIIQPSVGIFSDRVNTRFGKRMPFIMAGMPIAVLFLILLPNYSSFASLIAFLVLMNLSMSIFRSPVISLMPDITHESNRSKANSIINFMGGIGSLIAYFVGSILWDKNFKYPFYLGAILMLISFIIIFNFIKEKRDAIEYQTNERSSLNIFEAIGTGENKRNVVCLLLAICSWFIAYQGVEAFFTLYGQHYLGVKASVATSSFTYISLAFLVFAIPAGIIGTKIGKKKTIAAGIIGLIFCFGLVFFLKNILIIRIAFGFVGFFWSLININSYPFVTDMATKGKIGTFTGLYYFASSVAAIVSPPLLGLVIDLIGYRYMFAYGTFFFILALIFTLNVKNTGYVESSTVSEND